MHEIHQLLRSHRSIRAFKNDPLSDELVADIVQTGLTAATSSNLQATTVVRVQDQQIRARISEVAGGQQQIIGAGAFMVWCADLARTKKACEMAGGSMASGM